MGETRAGSTASQSKCPRLGYGTNGLRQLATIADRPKGEWNHNEGNEKRDPVPFRRATDPEIHEEYIRSLSQAEDDSPDETGLDVHSTIGQPERTEQHGRPVEPRPRPKSFQSGAPSPKVVACLRAYVC